MHERHYPSFILVAMLTLACQSPSFPSGESGGGIGHLGDGDGDGDGDDAGEGDGDGDGDGYCDFAQFPSSEPVWLVEITEGHKGEKPRVFGLAVGDDAVFSAGYSPEDGEKMYIFLDRRGLDGQQQWTREVESYGDSNGRSVGWDGKHVYYLTSPTLQSTGIARVTGDSQLDEWEFQGSDKFWLTDIEVSSSHVLGAGFVESESGDTSYDDAVFVRIDKEDPNIVDYDYTGEPTATEHGHVVTPWSSEAHVGATRGSHSVLWLRGYGDASITADLTFEAQEFPVAAFIHVRPEGFLLGGSADAGSWMSLVDPGGNEQWRKSLAPCGPGAVESLGPVAVGSDRVWGVVSGPADDYVYESFIAEFGFDGELKANYRVAALDGPTTLEAIATDGSAVVVSGFSYGLDTTLTGWLARVN